MNIYSALDFTKKKNWTKGFYDFDIDRLEAMLRKKEERFWRKKGEDQALRVFHQAAERVPAYKKFLAENSIKHKKIGSIEEFSEIPQTDKENYIKKYSLPERCWDGNQAKNSIGAISSGTSGEPTFWFRGAYQEFEASVVHELLYKHLFEVDKKKTLLIIGFPMGVYVSGVATLLASWAVAGKDYELTIISAGNKKEDILKSVRDLHGEYEQVLLVGHPFFLKDILETGNKEGIPWEKSNVKMLSCSEGFNETWRRHVVGEAKKGKRNEAFISVYGSSELLLIGYETPLSIFARSSLKDVEGGESWKNPNHGLFQYNPVMRYAEVEKKELIFTAASGTPLIRFNLHDTGSIVPYDEVVGFVEENGLLGRSKKGWEKEKKGAWKLPFLSLEGRSDNTIVFYAANIYPEHIRTALNHPDFLSKITGRFVMRKDYLSNKDQFLEINIELKEDVSMDAGFPKRIQEEIVKKLKEINIEYLFLCNNLDKDLTPVIKIRKYREHPYFVPGVKPKYIA